MQSSMVFCNICHASSLVFVTLVRWLLIATLIDSRSPNFTASLRFTYVGSKKDFNLLKDVKKYIVIGDVVTRFHDLEHL